MKVVDVLQSRREQWAELEQLCAQMENWRRRRMAADCLTRFAALYRAACADLALADAYHFPPATIDYLHQLVGRAHNQLYRSEAIGWRTWLRTLVTTTPRRLLTDRCLWLAAGVFWGVFLLAAAMSYSTPRFAEQVLGKEQMMMLEESFSSPVHRSAVEGGNVGSGMAGFYVFHNVGIGLRCVAFGLLLGIGGLYITFYNAAMLGASFGFMAQSPNAGNFYQFVTAHGPFELTAIVLCAAAGLRLGFSLVDTQGLTRSASFAGRPRNRCQRFGRPSCFSSWPQALKPFFPLHPLHTQLRQPWPCSRVCYWCSIFSCSVGRKKERWPSERKCIIVRSYEADAPR